MEFSFMKMSTYAGKAENIKAVVLEAISLRFFCGHRSEDVKQIYESGVEGKVLGWGDKFANCQHIDGISSHEIG